MCVRKRPRSKAGTKSRVGPSSDTRYPQLDIGPTRIGLDLDIIRYPFVKLGINLDYGFHGVRLKHVRLP